jgi:hypothetical protein
MFHLDVLIQFYIVVTMDLEKQPHHLQDQFLRLADQGFQIIPQRLLNYPRALLNELQTHNQAKGKDGILLM